MKHGLHVDEFGQALLHSLVDRAIQPHLKIPVETVRRRDLMRSVERATADFLIYRMTHPRPGTVPAPAPVPTSGQHA